MPALLILKKSVSLEIDGGKAKGHSSLVDLYTRLDETGYFETESMAGLEEDAGRAVAMANLLGNGAVEAVGDVIYRNGRVY